MNKTPIIRQYRFRSRGWDLRVGSAFTGPSPLAAGMDIAYFIYTNVDELMRTEQRLKESHALYEDTIDTLQVAMWTYDIAHRRIIMGNNKVTRALCQRFGWPWVFEDAPESLLPFIEEQDHAACLRPSRTSPPAGTRPSTCGTARSRASSPTAPGRPTTRCATPAGPSPPTASART